MAGNTTFDGFPPEGIQFLRDLGYNNNKAWFEAHKKTYIDSVQNPALAQFATLGERLQQHFPDIRYDTRINGSGSLMRIYRDTRFSADKSPYKTNVAMIFTPGTGKKMEMPGFGLQITPQSVGQMTGMFGFSKPTLEVYRRAVLDDTLGKALEDAAAKVRRAGNYTISGAEYKRVPSGYDANHPRAGWLKHTGLYAFAPEIGLDVAHFMNLSPIQQWLMKALY